MEFIIGEETEFKNIIPGNYEVYVSEVSKAEDDGKGGQKGSIHYKIREDVEQEFKGSEVRFDFINSASNMGWKRNKIAKAVGISVGVKFANLDEFLTAIEGKPLKINVSNETYNEKTYAKAKEYMPTEFPNFKMAANVLENVESEDTLGLLD